MRKIVPDNWNTYCDGKDGDSDGKDGEGGDSDGKEGTVMGRRGQ